MAQSNPAAQTAAGPMVIAAVEQNEPIATRIVEDPLAAHFAPPSSRWFISATKLRPVRAAVLAVSNHFPGGWSFFVCRKRYIDDQLAAAAEQYDAVVDLGAGLDTRGCRLAPIPVFEVDQPVNTERKARTIERALGAIPESVHLVPVDFARDDLGVELQRNGYDPALRTFFIWEGVTQYIPESAARSTLTYLSKAAPGSRLAFTYVERDFIDGKNLYGNKVLYNKFRVKSQVWMFGLDPAAVAPLLAEYGWRLVEDVSGDDFQERYLTPLRRRLSTTALEHTVYAEKL